MRFYFSFVTKNEKNSDDAVKKWEDHHRMMMRGRDGREVKEWKSNDDARLLLLRGRVVLLLLDGGRKRSASRFF